MAELDLKRDDITRLNELVTKRKQTMEMAKSKNLDTIMTERYQFYVTAYKLGIHIQLRIINLAETSQHYKTNIVEINDARCLLDKILENKKDDPDDVRISNREGKAIRQQLDLFKRLFGKEGAPAESKLEYYYENGIGLEEKVRSLEPEPNP